MIPNSYSLTSLMFLKKSSSKTRFIRSIDSLQKVGNFSRSKINGHKGFEQADFVDIANCLVEVGFQLIFEKNRKRKVRFYIFVSACIPIGIREIWSENRLSMTLCQMSGRWWGATGPKGRGVDDTNKNTKLIPDTTFVVLMDGNVRADVPIWTTQKQHLKGK